MVNAPTPIAGAPATWVLLGCGYTGTRLVRAVVERGRGERVVATRRDPVALAEVATLGDVTTMHADLGVPASLAAVSAQAGPGAIVVICAPPGANPGRELADVVAAMRTAARVIYLSSTGVYGPAHGALVDETALLAPTSATGHARVLAEAALAAACGAATPPVPWLVLRPAGIYGPGRMLADRLRAPDYRVVGDGTSHVCRIHVDDLVTTILAAADHPRVTGAINVADDDPTPLGIVVDTVAAHLGLPAPPRVPASSVPPDVASMLTSDRRIANGRLHAELGVTLRYPSWRTTL